MGISIHSSMVVCVRERSCPSKDRKVYCCKAERSLGIASIFLH